MRFFATIAALALAASVSAQDTSSSSATAVESASTTASLSPQQTCLAACDASDICCQAACVNVPCPNEAQVNATTECAGQCPQGNGTQEETDAYAACQSSCISSYFLTATDAPTATGANGAAATATGASTTGINGASSGSSASRTSSGSSASASESGNAAPETRVAIAGAGLVGLIIAGLAL